MKNIPLILLLWFCGTIKADLFQVDLTVIDQIDGDPGNGVCEIPTGGFCTLRAAIMEANALPGPDAIVLPGDSTIRLTLTGSDENASATGDLDITDALSIGAFTEDTENYPIIDANLLDDRIFHVLSGSGAVSFVNMRLINGSADFSNGGAINISIDNQVEVNRVWFEDNTADSGGAIYLTALSELEVIDSVFRGNASVSQGGAMTLFSPTEIVKTTIFENLNFNNEFNEAVYVGVDIFGSSGLNVRNSTLFNNSNSGVYAQGADLSVRNSTITDHDDRGVLSNPTQTTTPDLRIRNSVFDQNTFSCSVGSVNLLTDNWNVSSDSTSCLSDQTTNNTNRNPKLSGVQTDVENWHRYYRPGFLSPLVDSGHPAAPGSPIGCEDQDQRGLTRPQDSYSDGIDRCDIGAIELSEDIIFYDNIDINNAIQQ